MEFTTLKPLLWLLVLLVLGAGYWSTLVDRPRGLKLGSFLLRVLGIVLLILALCRPFSKNESEDVHVVFLVDVSESVELDSAISSLADIDAAIGALEVSDSWSLFAIANGVKKFEKTADLKKLLEDWRTGLKDDEFRSGSRLADALLNTRLAFPAGKAKRIALFSDGQETASDNLAEPIKTLAKEDVEIQFGKLEGLKKPEASIVSIGPSSPFAYQGEMVRMKTVVAANQEMKAQLRILHKGVAVKNVAVNLKARGDNIFCVDVEMNTPGPSVWAAELIPEKDYFPINNQLATTVQVKGKPRILILHQDPVEMRPFARALKEQEFDVDVRGNLGLPETMEELLAFDAVVIADVPATDMSVRQMAVLQKYVADFGGGLAMFGSDNSFGLGGYYKTPVEEVLPLISRFEKEKEKPSLGMVLVIDKSGSMQGAPIEMARQAAKAAVELLGVRDQIAVIGFDSQPQIVSEMRSGAEKDSVMASIDSLAAGGGTDIYPSMVVGKEMLENVATKVKHMIILSDGQTQQADHLGLTQAMADSGVTVSTVALGQGAARELMASIAEVGRGRYYETMDAASVPQIFTKETMQASKSAIKEDLFGIAQTGDHPILSGYNDADLPFSLGYVMTEPKPTAQVLLVAETGDPLLAVSRFGLGMGMAWTSDLTEKWGGEWLAWDECGKFWAQAFRGLVRKSDAAGMTSIPRKHGDKWIIDITRQDQNRVPISQIEWNASFLDENGQTVVFPVKETGLGRYRAEVPIGKRDDLTMIIRDTDFDKQKTHQFTAEYPAEYRLGSELPSEISDMPTFSAQQIRTGVIPISRHQAVMHWFVFAAIACLLGGMVLRRI